MSTLLPFHKDIIQEICDPATSDLLVVARALGLRRIVCSLMQIYDSPKNLVLLVNASPEEETAIGEELGIMRCRRPGLRVVGYETPRQERQALYQGGGLIMVTSRILVVDMLQSDIPIDLISGILVLHAENSSSVKPAAPVIDLVDDEDAWDALNEAEGIQIDKKGKGKEKKDRRPEWLPTGLDPILEELPKWDLLTQVLDEIEEEIVKLEMMKKSGPRLGSDTVLVMASSTRTCNLITDFLSSHNPTGTKGAKGRDMMMQKLRVYLWWKGKLSQRKEEGKSSFHLPDAGSTAASMKDPKGTSLSEALRKKDKEKAERNQSRKRSSSAPAKPEADVLAEFWSQVTPDASITPFDVSSIALLDLPDLDDNYGLVVPSQTVVVRAYSDDSDDRIFAELQPRFIVMYEPNMECIRRIEVYRSASPGMGVRVYHMVYGGSCEEHKYLASIRKEKESFERLIKERATMLMPIYEERREGAGRNKEVTKTISSRYAEFEEDKAFSLELITEMKSYIKPTGKYPAKKKPDAAGPNNTTAYSSVSVQSKLVLLTLHFPRLRIIWSSSPFSSSEIFTDLKRNQAEPDPTKAIAVGADDDPDAGRGVNTAAEELVRCLPGVTAKNVKYLMSRVGSVD
ncbi:hypothetical protein H1R20_g3808, partial [Candolleomyces eurysporus]